MYTNADKCTRCCTATVKRSLDLMSPRHSHRFLLPPSSSSRIRIPMWLQPAATIQRASPSILKHRRHRRPARLNLLDEILFAASNSRGT
ncbi:unnamed protein product [Strongylus vulgaris]|uniref:Uncharacterized protein n=1 Tax=Strongylus vulgaris TaxID=40348 RepID=A0A3P7KPY4_STRVU|nr:unnamed protein product [Strongylus vulgaris]